MSYIPAFTFGTHTGPRPKKCMACSRPAVCVALAGLSVFFTDSSHGGKPYHDQDRPVYLCGTCCGHGEDCSPIAQEKP